MAATVQYLVSRIGPILPVSLRVDHFKQIRGTVNSTLAATGLKKIKALKKIRIYDLKMVLWIPHVELVNYGNFRITLGSRKKII